MNKGETFSFDEESRYLFGAAAPDYDAAHFEAILGDINALLDGEGNLSVRVNRFRDQFVIPPDRLAARPGAPCNPVWPAQNPPAQP